MEIIQYIVDDFADGKKHLITGHNERQARSNLLVKLMGINSESEDSNGESVFDERLQKAIIEDRFHELLLSDIDRWLDDIEVQEERTHIGTRTIVCLCGSTRFSDAYQQANLDETVAGKIVLTIGCDMRSDADLFESMDEKELQKLKEDLDELHFRKIDLADEILVLNVHGYVGQSTKREIKYAESTGKLVRWLDMDNIPVID